MSRCPALRHVVTVLCAAGLAASFGAGPASATFHPRSSSHRTGAGSSRRAGQDGRIWFNEGFVGDLGSVDPLGGTADLVAPGTNGALSADGTRIVYEGDGGVSVINADGTGDHLVTDAGTDPDWSPDGSRIVFTDQDDLWVVDADGAHLTQLTSTSGLAEADPAWSPSGDTIAYTAEGCLQSGGGSCVFSLPIGSGGATGAGTNLTPEEDFTCGSDPFDLDVTAGRPTWSPDGSQIAFRDFAGCLDGGTGTDIWRMNANGSGKVDLTPDTSTGDDYPTWSPDGTTIAFLSDRGHDDDQHYLFEVPAAGGSPTEIAIDYGHANDHLSDPDWAAPVTTRAASLTLKATDPRLRKPGQERFTLRLLPDGTAAYAGQRLTLQKKGKKGWQDVAHATARTDDAGKATLSTKVGSTATYRAVYLANPALGLRAAKSDPETVKVG